MTTTRDEISTRHNPPAGVASLKVDNRRFACLQIAKRYGLRAFVPLSGNMLPTDALLALEAASEAGRRYPARGAKGRAR